MTKMDLTKLETTLEARARALARSLAERNEIIVERSADEFDNALLAAGRETAARSLSQDVRLLREIAAARDRLREGRYGTCGRCEEKIAPKRLQAIPWATYCVSCQEDLEEGDTTLGRAA